MLIFKNIKKSYETKIIYENFNLKLPNLGLVSLIGKSGSGKSTLLNLIAGIDKPNLGDIIFNDLILTNLSENERSHFLRNKVGFIYQDYQLIETKTVYENIKLGLSFSGYKNNDYDEKIKKIAFDLNINDLLDKYPYNLSGGEKQRTAIARALIKDPKIILADEPTGAIDSNQSLKIMDILKDISKDRLVIIASHDLSLMNQYADFIYSIDNKEIIKDDSKPVLKKETLIKQNIKLKTLFNYATKNILDHYLRSLLLLFTLVISLIGISSSYHFSDALNYYIKSNDEQFAKVFPIEIDTLSLTLEIDKEEDEKYEYLTNKEYVIPARIQGLFYYVNNLDLNFYNYMKTMNIDDIDQVSYIYDIKFNFLKYNNDALSFTNLTINPLNKSDYLLEEEYDILYKNINNGDIELTLVVDKYNRINYSIFDSLGISLTEALSFSSLNNFKIYYYGNDDLYEKISDTNFKQAPLNELNLNDAKTAIISRVIRQKSHYEINGITPGIYMNNNTYKDLFNENLNSGIVSSQLSLNSNVLTGINLNDSKDKDNALKKLGYFYYPNSYRISTLNKAAKDKVLSFINEYSDDKIIPLDKGSLGLEAAKSAFDLFSLLGSGFIIISLLSSIFIVILTTYLSIMEKSREIGILKTLGANNKNINLIFGLELLIISSISGFISLLTTYFLIPLFNNIVVKRIKAPHIFKFREAFMYPFIIGSILLILIIGLIPILSFNKKNVIENINLHL